MRKVQESKIRILIYVKRVDTCGTMINMDIWNMVGHSYFKFVSG